jgi:hypothetical protein
MLSPKPWKNDVLLPTEPAVAFQLSQPLEIAQ